MDLIDRQEVDKIIDDLLENDNLQASPSVWHGLHMIKQLPSAQPEPQWVPCSERLPKEDTKVFVTDEDGDIYIAYYDYNEWSDDPKIEWWTGEFRIYPIAWMPLPKPWKGEQS